VLAEIHGERADGEPTELVANVGVRRMLTPQLILLLAVGRPVRSVPDEGPRGNLYIGLQFNLPGQYSIEPGRTSAPNRNPVSDPARSSDACTTRLHSSFKRIADERRHAAPVHRASERRRGRYSWDSS
jgi:hypothetical protein